MARGSQQLHFDNEDLTVAGVVEALLAQYACSFYPYQAASKDNGIVAEIFYSRTK